MKHQMRTIMKTIHLVYKPILLMLLLAYLLSGCESLSSSVINDSEHIPPLQIQTGDSDSNAFKVVEAEEITEDPLPRVETSETTSTPTVAFGKRSRPAGRYLPLVLFPFDSWHLTP